MQKHYFSDEFIDNKVVRRSLYLVTMVAWMDKWWLILSKKVKEIYLDQDRDMIRINFIQ